MSRAIAKRFQPAGPSPGHPRGTSRSALLSRGSFSIPKPASAVKLAGARVRMQGSDGSSITVRLNPVSQYGDRALHGKLFSQRESRRLQAQMAKQPIHVFIDGITVDGAQKLAYTTTMLAP